nr:hypothetical protein [Beihai hepe-like virus 4]
MQKFSTYRRFNAHLYGRKSTASSDNILDTLLKRFDNDGMSFTQSAREVGTLLTNSFMEIVDQITPITLEQVMLKLAESYQRVKNKNDVIHAMEFDPDIYNSFIKISSFNKAQTKVKMAEESYLQTEDGVLKAGQPISAQPKFMTHLASAFNSAIEENIRNDLKEGFYLGYGMNERELDLLVRSRVPTEFSFMSVESDITQMDSVRGTATNQNFMAKIYDLYGMPTICHKVADTLNMKWVADANIVSLLVKGRFHSGRFDTLSSNTIVNLALSNYAFKIEKPHLVLAMGDDFAAIAEKITLVNNFEFLKVNFTDIPEFTNNLIGDRLYPSIVKKAGKLLNREFRDAQDLEAYRYAVKDWIKNYRDTLSMHVICAVNSYKYGIDVEQVQALWSFLRNFADARIVTSFDDSSLIKYSDVPSLLIENQEFKR